MKKSLSMEVKLAMKDLLYTLRLMARRPGLTAAALVTLTLGTGASAAIFSLVNGVVLRPFPYKDPDRIITLWQHNAKAGIPQQETSPANFLDWRDQQQSFQSLVSIEPWSFEYVASGEPEKFRASLVTENFFETLGAQALHGRALQKEDYRPDSDKVVVLSYGLWKRWLGGSPEAIGQTVSFLDEGTCTIVGVMPPEFQFPDKSRDIWAPFTDEDRYKGDRRGTYIKVIGRLRDDVTLEQARADMEVIGARLASEYPQYNEGIGIKLVPLPEQIVGEIRPAMLVLLGAVGFVLILACANVANIMLSRGLEREHEIAIRAAMGASRRRIIRQLLTESLTLALAGGAGGLLLSYWLIDIIVALSPASLPRIEQISVDGRVLGFSLAVSVLTALVFGLAPALQFSKPDLNLSLKQGGRSTTSAPARHRTRNLLVVAEMALAIVLLIGAGLLLRSFVNLLRVDPGFEKENILALQVFAYGEKYRTPQHRAAFFRDTIERISNIPGVKTAGAVSAVPFLGEDSIDIDTTFIIEGRPAPPPAEEPTVFVSVATENYFSALGIPLIEGRTFKQTDDLTSPPVVLINETLARRYFKDENPVGKKIQVRFGRAASYEIIGVVGDVRQTGLDSAPRPEVFRPHSQYPFGSMTFIIRASSDPAAAMAAVKSQIWQVDPRMTFYNLATMEQLISTTLASRRFNLMVIGTFAIAALLLAAIGIYGVMSFSTTQRTHEIGVRMALGAESGDMIRLVLRQGMMLVLAGISIGLIAALALTRFISSFLFEVSAFDPATFAGVSALLTTVALAACYIPARRAARVDPMIALRYE
ncbi:MAG: ABC transporter permease [Acidobacteriota bacterium]